MKACAVGAPACCAPGGPTAADDPELQHYLDCLRSEASASLLGFRSLAGRVFSHIERLLAEKADELSVRNAMSEDLVGVRGERDMLIAERNALREANHGMASARDEAVRRMGELAEQRDQWYERASADAREVQNLRADVAAVRLANGALVVERDALREAIRGSACADASGRWSPMWKAAFRVERSIAGTLDRCVEDAHAANKSLRGRVADLEHRLCEANAEAFTLRNSRDATEKRAQTAVGDLQDNIVGLREQLSLEQQRRSAALAARDEAKAALDANTHAAENRVNVLQGMLDSLRKLVTERGAEIDRLKDERDGLSSKLSVVVAAAEAAGWNGVERSKLLSRFVTDLAEQARHSYANGLRSGFGLAQEHAMVRAHDEIGIRISPVVDWGFARQRLEEALKGDGK